MTVTLAFHLDTPDTLAQTATAEIGDATITISQERLTQVED